MTGKAFPIEGRRIWVAGHKGMVGSAVVRRLASETCTVLTIDREALDLRRTGAVFDYLGDEKPDAVILAAARVGGIMANDSRPADFLADNLAIQQAVITGVHKTGVRKLLFLGSSCIYPSHAPQPIPETALLTGALEPTNEAYAIAKIAGLKLCAAYRRQYGSDFIAAMPTNLYGPHDNFDLQTSHVIPALIHKAHLAKTGGHGELVIWGSGSPRREVLHVDDCADALVFLLKNYSQINHINVDAGTDQSILDIARMICRVVGFEGSIVADTSKPDGTPAKLMAIDKMTALGWVPGIELEVGIAATYRWFLDNIVPQLPNQGAVGQAM